MSSKVIAAAPALVMVLAGQALAQPVTNPAELIQQERLMATLKELPTSRAAMGDEAGREGLRKTEALIEKKLKELGYTPVLQEFKWALPAKDWPTEAPKPDSPKPDPAKPDAARPDDAKPGTDSPAPESAKVLEHTWHNIIVNIPGSELPNEVVLIGAHFDAVPGAPGADDNGTGTAALLEVARVLKDHPTKRTIRLVFFNLEECGLIGSSRYVTQARPDWKGSKNEAGQAQPPKEKIVGMVSLEMLGYFSDEPNSQKSPLPPVKDVFDPPTVGDTIAVVGLKGDQAFISKLTGGMQKNAPGLKLTVVDFLPFPIPDMTRSDHRPFMLAGIPAVMVTDTANFRNPNYHQPTDTVETIDAKRFTLVAKAIAGATYDLAESAPK
jgi:Zn-dependent M28 family amino/carboxypeptidase